MCKNLLKIGKKLQLLGGGYLKNPHRFGGRVGQKPCLSTRARVGVSPNVQKSDHMVYGWRLAPNLSVIKIIKNIGMFCFIKPIEQPR